MLQAYYVTIQTRQAYDADEYTLVAGQLSNALQSTLGDITTLRAVTHTPNLTQTRVEVEISQLEERTSPVLAHAIVRGATEDKMHLDKNMLSKLVRDELPFAVKITKQAVTSELLVPTNWTATAVEDAA